MKFSNSVFARRAVVVVLAAIGAVAPQMAIAQKNPLVGTWNLVPEKSTATPGSIRYKSMTITIPDPTVMNVEGVDAQGKPVKGTYQAVVDGKPHPITGIPAYDTGSWTRFNDNTTTFTYNKGKNIAALGNRVLSPDGSTLTIREQIYDGNGKQTVVQVLVFRNPDVQVASVPPPVAAAPVIAPPVQSGPSPDEAAGMAALEKGDADAAIAAFTRSLDKSDKGPNAVYDHVSRGVAYAKKGQNDQALADFDAAVKLKPDDTDALFRRGGARLTLEQYPGAIEDFTAVIKADEMHALAYRLRGFIYNKLGDDKNAGADYDKACALNKEYCL
jgi:tetratricopeptide (TPR) repeat protein